MTENRNHPDRSDDLLLESARNILTSRPTVFTVQPWRNVMPKANADAKKQEMKTAERSLARRGVNKPKHVPKASEEGVDTQPADVVQSGFSVFNQQAQEPIMSDSNTTTTTKPTPEEKAAKIEARAAAQAAREEAVKAKIAAKEEKQRLAAEKKAAAEAEKARKAAEREARAAEKKAAAEVLAENGGYHGPMIALRDAKARYVKATNGRLRSSDEVASLFDAVEPVDVITIAMTALKLEANPYASLNIGQQSMNLRNKLRGALKKGVVTLDDVKTIRDSGGYTAKVEQRLAEIQAKKAAREAKKAAANEPSAAMEAQAA